MEQITDENMTGSGTVEKVLEDSIKEIEDSKKKIEVFIPQPQNRITNENLINNDRENLTLHNEQYTNLLKIYVKNFQKTSKRKLKHREDVFQIAISFLVVIPVIMVIMTVYSFFFACKGYDFIQFLPATLTALTTVVGSLFVILKIITQYLFNKNEEENLTKIISEIQKYDSKIRDDIKESHE